MLIVLHVILCKYKEVQIIDGAVCVDYIHLSVAIPPKLSISSFYGIPEREKYASDWDILLYRIFRYIIDYRYIVSSCPEYLITFTFQFWVPAINQKSQGKKKTEVLLYRGPVTMLAVPAFTSNTYHR